VSHITRQTLSFYRESKQPISVHLSELIDSVLALQESALQTSQCGSANGNTSPQVSSGGSLLSFGRCF
jgi:hypothetical protein